MTGQDNTMHARHHPEDFLPFVVKERGQHHYWRPARTGDPYLDHCLGVLYGMYCIEYLQTTQIPDIIEDIVRHMPVPPGKVEEGFFEAWADYIATGAVSLGGFEFLSKSPRRANAQ